MSLWGVKVNHKIIKFLFQYYIIKNSKVWKVIPVY